MWKFLRARLVRTKNFIKRHFWAVNAPSGFNAGATAVVGLFHLQGTLYGTPEIIFGALCAIYGHAYYFRFKVWRRSREAGG